MWFLSFPASKLGYRLARCSGSKLHLFRYSETGKQLDAGKRFLSDTDTRIDDRVSTAACTIALVSSGEGVPAQMYAMSAPLRWFLVRWISLLCSWDDRFY
jgi:hypothetical protein